MLFSHFLNDIFRSGFSIKHSIVKAKNQLIKMLNYPLVKLIKFQRVNGTFF